MTSNHIARGNALGFLCRVMIAPRRGKSIFLPTVTLLPCQGAVCYVTQIPQGVTLGWWLIVLSGAHAAVRLGNCDTTEGMPLLLDYVLCCNGRNAVRQLG